MKLAEAAQAFMDGGEEALRELLRNNEETERDEKQTQNQTASTSTTSQKTFGQASLMSPEELRQAILQEVRRRQREEVEAMFPPPQTE